ncbi:MAG: hypothetical protein ACTS3F_03260 [Phycisphaerales bacterium]
MASLNNVGASALNANARSIGERIVTPSKPAGARAIAPRLGTSDSGSPTARTDRTDSVRLSPEALAANAATSDEGIAPDRLALIQDIRSQLADDAYLSDEKLDIALDRLIDDALGLA